MPTLNDGVGEGIKLQPILKWSNLRHTRSFFSADQITHYTHTHRHTRSAQLTRIDHLQYATVAHGALPKAQRNSSWIKVELAHRELEVQVLEFDAQFGYANTHTHTLIDTHTHCVRAIESRNRDHHETHRVTRPSEITVAELLF